MHLSRKCLFEINSEDVSCDREGTDFIHTEDTTNGMESPLVYTPRREVPCGQPKLCKGEAEEIISVILGFKRCAAERDEPRKSAE